MSYSTERANPSLAAHAAAESADRIFESLADGLDISDGFVAFAEFPEFVAYCFEDGIAKGESISRMMQVLHLLERDNALLANAIEEPWSGTDMPGVGD